MELDDALEQAYLLPTIPAVVHELLGSFDRSDIDVDAISSRVALDPVIAGKVLRMANSAQFCRGRRIGSIHDAVMVLGFNRLRTLVIASGAAMMSPNLPGFDHVAFWRHNLQTACLARAIGTLVETRPEECFVAGLMHGIGQLLLRSIEPELYRTIDAVVATGEPAGRPNRQSWGWITPLSEARWRVSGDFLLRSGCDRTLRRPARAPAGRSPRGHTLACRNTCQRASGG